MGVSMRRALMTAVVILLALAAPSYAPYFRDPAAAEDGASRSVQKFDLFRYELEHSPYLDGPLSLAEVAPDPPNTNSAAGF